MDTILIVLLAQITLIALLWVWCIWYDGKRNQDTTTGTSEQLPNNQHQ